MENTIISKMTTTFSTAMRDSALAKIILKSNDMTLGDTAPDNLITITTFSNGSINVTPQHSH